MTTRNKKSCYYWRTTTRQHHHGGVLRNNNTFMLFGSLLVFLLLMAFNNNNNNNNAGSCALLLQVNAQDTTTTATATTSILERPDVSKKVDAALRLISGYVKSFDPLPAAMWYDSQRLVDRVVNITDVVFSEAFDPIEDYKDVMEYLKLKAKELSLQHHTELIRITAPMGRSKVVDPYIDGMMKVMEDPDCMEREFILDDNPDNTFWNDAVDVFRKCKLLVIKNVFDKDFMEEYRSNITSFLYDLHEGKISSEGSTTHFDKEYITKTHDSGRWDVVLPRDLSSGDIMGEEHVHYVINRERVLSADVKLLTYGLLLTESGATDEIWRSREEPSLFSDKGLNTHGLAGHDIPTTAAMMIVPLKDTSSSEDEGQMEFCMGSSWMQGFTIGENPLEELVWDDPTLFEKAETLVGGKGLLHELSNGGNCPQKMVRRTKPQFGDLVIFDYKLKYRSVANKSNNFLANVYVTYGREWFKDVKEHFDPTKDNYYDYFLKVARFALPDPSEVCQSNEDNTGCIDGVIDPTLRLEDVRDFLHHKRQHVPDDSLIGEEFEFAVTNMDIDDEDYSPQIWVEDEYLGDIPLGQTHFVKAAAGEILSIKDSKTEGTTALMSWKIRPYQTQLAASKMYIQTTTTTAEE